MEGDVRNGSSSLPADDVVRYDVKKPVVRVSCSSMMINSTVLNLLFDPLKPTKFACPDVLTRHPVLEARTPEKPWSVTRLWISN